MEFKTAVTMVVGMILLATPALPYPGGAPTSRCGTMIPGHGSVSTAAVPYTITVSPTTYKAGTTITVTVSGSDFRGILMQVRKAGDTTPQGTWSSPPADTKLLTCTAADDSVTHANMDNKLNAVFTWTAPDGVMDNLQVIATVAQAKIVWWTGVMSATLTYDSTLSTPTPPTTTTTSSMSTHFGPSAGSVFMTVLVALLTLQFY